MPAPHLALSKGQLLAPAAVARRFGAGAGIAQLLAAQRPAHEKAQGRLLRPPEEYSVLDVLGRNLTVQQRFRQAASAAANALPM